MAMNALQFVSQSSESTAPRASDHALMASIRAGDLSGLGELFDRYAAQVARLLERAGIPSSDVDDLVQQTFLEVLKASPRFRPDSPVRPWLFGLALMMARRHRRSLSRMLARLARWTRDHEERDGATLERGLEERPDARRAHDALLTLSPKKREVFILSVFGELTGPEIADQLGVPVATVWTRLHHARNELRTLMEAQ
jgi:RNA polymerase sigma-70 factor (ECF subfamily)